MNSAMRRKERREFFLGIFLSTLSGATALLLFWLSAVIIMAIGGG